MNKIKKHMSQRQKQGYIKSITSHKQNIYIRSKKQNQTKQYQRYEKIT